MMQRRIRASQVILSEYTKHTRNFSSVYCSALLAFVDKNTSNSSCTFNVRTPRGAS